MRTANGTDERKQYLHTVAQLQYYMVHYGCRHGSILTEQELVIFRIIDTDNGDGMEFTRPVLCIAEGSIEEPEMTVMLSLWYLGMFLTDDEV